MTQPAPQQRPDRRPDERRLVGTAVDGRYEVLEVLGVGGMSTVYRAHDNRLERNVAIKVISPSLGADDSFLRRFSSEARASARLAHPNIVHVLDRSSEQSLPYIVFEYVPGRTLRQVVAEESPLPGRAALGLWRQLIEALSSAHESGLVHRDVKPDNVLVTDRGIAKLTDFGLARAVAEARTTATIMGTARYVAPEVITDSHSDARSDIYSAGVVLFELLTGVPPFAGANPINVAYAHVHREVPPPSQIEPGIHPELDSLVTWCCAKDPENRPVSAHAILTELEHILTLLPSDPPRPSRPPRVSAPTIPLERENPAEQVVSEASTRAFPALPPFLSENDDATRALPRTDFGPLTTEDEDSATGLLSDPEAEDDGVTEESLPEHRADSPQPPARPWASIHEGPALDEGPQVQHSDRQSRPSGSSVRREIRDRAKSARQPLRSVRKSGNSTLTTVVVVLLTFAALALGILVYGVSHDSGSSIFQVGQAAGTGATQASASDMQKPGALRPRP